MCFKKLAAWVSSRSRMQHFSCARSVPSFQTRDSRAHISSTSSALHGDDNINGDSLTRVSVTCRARRYGAGSGRNLGRGLGRPRRGPPNGSQIYVDHVLALFSASPPLPILVLLPYPCITQGLVFLKQKETSLRSICIFIQSSDDMRPDTQREFGSTHWAPEFFCQMGAPAGQSPTELVMPSIGSRASAIHLAT